MDFEPFHSDGDEEMASIMPEKKKKDGEKWKKSKGGPLFRNEKKMTYNDIHSPPGVKGKHNVHGVVGPAEYIYEQGNSPGTEQSPTLLTQAMSQSSGGLPPVSSIDGHPGVLPGGAAGINVTINPSVRTEIPQQPSSVIPQKPSAVIPQKPSSIIPQKPLSRTDLPQQSSHSPGLQKQYSTGVMPDHPHTPGIQKQYSLNVMPDHSQQSSAHVPQMQFTNPANFQPNFPPISSIPTKIDRERPHCSPAALPQIAQIPQGPTPFKHPPQGSVPQKSTLLSQAMGITQFQQPSAPPSQPMPVTAPNTPYQRNQSYSQAVSVPIPIPEPNNADFNPNQERTISITQEYPESPLPESRGPLTSPPLSPLGGEVVEGVWPLSEVKTSPVPHEYVDSAWANFHPAVPLQYPYDGDNDDNRRKSHGADSLSESIPESMSSADSELDESVWKINSEQREYYTKQFKKIQPDVAEVIKGPQARDFFLKSNLPNETLSTIWQLSDMDKDAALNLNEFCIAMHLVVAVKHGVELPALLPPTLLSGSFSEECDRSFSETRSVSEEPLVSENLHESDEENKGSSISDDESISSSVDTVNSESSNVRTASQPIDDNNKDDASQLSPDWNNSAENALYNTPIKDISSRVRPRASAQKNVNLMDSSPWQLLPPPSSKGKPLVKKNLNMDDDAAFTSNESIEQMNSFSSPEQIAKDMSSVNEYMFSDDNDIRANNKTENNRNAGMPREKSRSIDSLRLDMNEDYTSIEMRRISKELRPRSFSGEGHIIKDALSKRTSKEIEMPPVPPPREKGHVRASSLDSSKMFATTDAEEITPVGTELQQQHTKDVKLSISPKPGSGEDEKSEDLNTKEKSTAKEIPPSSIMTNSPRSSRLHSQRDVGNETVKHVVRFSDELDVHDDSLSAPNLIDKKMRKHELQARVRLLKSYNTTLNNLLTQLHMEWKSVSEERIALDIMLQKEKQQGLS